MTGAAGSVGRAFCHSPVAADVELVATDVETLDVTNPSQVGRWTRDVHPDVVLHLAGAKHAPDGELDPQRVTAVNAVGTINVVAAANRSGARVVTASTCKACDPETAYGASKLLAERITLNAGGTVVRYYNIPESDGNVFRLWESLPPDEPLPVARQAFRYFLSMEVAVALTRAVLDVPSGRYTVDPGEGEFMWQVAERIYPGREHVDVPLRRGDRRVEKLCASSEQMTPFGFLTVITSQHDPVWEGRTDDEGV